MEKATADQSRPASDYLVVESDGTRHLPVKRNGKPDHNLMGAAWAALHGGYRGNKYEGPDKAAAIAKLRKLYAAEGMETPKSAVLLPMTITKAERLEDGRVRWRARANSGDFDLENERFDNSFWLDVVHNFGRQVEATAKGEAPPDGMPIPILDLAHYSFRLPADQRNKAQTGWIERLWQDGTALMALGYFCDTPLGRAAAKAAITRPATERRVSVGVWPDWGRVELRDGKRIYKGGRNRAYLDHLAMTAHPVDPNTLLEVKSMNQKDDALDVLGDDEGNKALVDELEEAKGKSIPDGAVIKADEEEQESESEAEEEQEAEEEEEEELEADPEQEQEPEEEPEPEMLSVAELTATLKSFTDSLANAVDDRLVTMEEAVGELQKSVKALAIEDTAKIKAAIDQPDNWLWKAMQDHSVRAKSSGVKGEEDEEEPAQRSGWAFVEKFGSPNDD